MAARSARLPVTTPGQRVPLNSFQRLTVFCGKSAIDRYTGTQHAPLVIGTTRLSYSELAIRTGLPGGVTARKISAIASSHSATSIADLYRKSSPHSVAVHGFGACSLLMLFRLFQSEGLDVEKWARSSDEIDVWRDHFTTWDTYKQRELAADRRTAKTPASGPREKGYRRTAIREQQKADAERGV